MRQHFRCGIGANCPQGNKIVAGQDWQCPLKNPNCQSARIPVARHVVHARRLKLAAAGLVIGLLIWMVIGKLGASSEKKELGDLNREVTVLESRLSALEAKPRDGSGPDAATSLRALLEQARQSQNKANAMLKAEQPDQAALVVKGLDDLLKQSASLLQTARNPKPNSGVLATEAHQLASDFQSIEDRAESVRNRLTEKNQISLVPGCEALIDQIADALRRTGRLAGAKQNPTDQAAVAGFVEQIKRSVQETKALVGDYVPPVRAPFKDEEATLIIETSSDLAETLIIPALREKSGGTATLTEPGKWHYITKKGVDPSERVIVRNTGAACLQNLLADKPDLVVTDLPLTSKLKAEESQAFKGGNLESSACAQVIALDALTLVAHPDSTLSVVQGDDLLKRSWMGGRKDSAQRLLAERFGLTVGQEVERRSADAVLADAGAQGLGCYHQEGGNIRAKRLAFKAGKDTPSFQPSPFTIATEDYKFGVRIHCLHHPNPKPAVIELVNFFTSDRGQKVVFDQNYVDLRLRPAGGELDARIRTVLAASLGLRSISGAQRLSINIHFATGKYDFDLKAIGDLERLPRELANSFSDKKIVVLGYTDSTGDPSIHLPLSQHRSEAVAKRLQIAGVTAKFGGLGNQFPVDSEDAEEGRARNRRAEIWAVTP